MLNEPDNPLRHYAGVLQRRSRWIFFGLILGVVLGGLASLVIKPKPITTHYYKATNTLTLDSGTASVQSSGSVVYSLAQAAQLIQSQKLLDAVGKKTNMTGIEAGQSLSAIPRQDEYALDVTGISTNPETAVALANTASSLLNTAARDAATEAYQVQLDTYTKAKTKLTDEMNKLLDTMSGHPANEAALKSQYDSDVSQLQGLTTQIESLGATAPTLQLNTLRKAHAIEINKACYSARRDLNINAPGSPTNQTTTSSSDGCTNETHIPKPSTLSRTSLILLGGGLGLLIGFIVAFTIEAWDDRIRNRTRVESLTDLPVLAEIPNLTHEQASTFAVSMVDNAKSPTAERYRATCTAVLFALGETATGRPDAQFSNGNGSSSGNANGNGNGNGATWSRSRTGRAGHLARPGRRQDDDLGEPRRSLRRHRTSSARGRRRLPTPGPGSLPDPRPQPGGPRWAGHDPGRRRVVPRRPARS